MREKRGKFRVIFDASTQSYQHELVLNQVTDSEFEAIIDFGQSKMRLYVSIHNWRIIFRGEIIYLILADISACFRYPRIAADLTGAFGFMFKKLYFLSTSHVFGSNTSASSWEPFRRAIKNSIPIYFFREDLVIKHKDFLDTLKWDESPAAPNFVKAVRCELNKGVLNDDSTLSPPSAEVYVDDITAAAVRKEWILKLLAAIIESIFVVCGRPDTDVRQCPFSLEKWGEDLWLHDPFGRNFAGLPPSSNGDFAWVQHMVKSMAARPLILALANPTPEILPEEVLKVRSDAIMATGRTDYPNQVNNVLCFPYIFRGALDAGAIQGAHEGDRVRGGAGLGDELREDGFQFSGRRILDRDSQGELVVSIVKGHDLGLGDIGGFLLQLDLRDRAATTAERHLDALVLDDKALGVGTGDGLGGLRFTGGDRDGGQRSGVARLGRGHRQCGRRSRTFRSTAWRSTRPGTGPAT